MQSIPRDERVVIGEDINGYVGESNRDDEKALVRWNAKRMEMAAAITVFQKRQENRATYESGGRSIQMDYILGQRCT